MQRAVGSHLLGDLQSPHSAAQQITLHVHATRRMVAIVVGIVRRSIPRAVTRLGRIARLRSSVAVASTSCLLSISTWGQSEPKPKNPAKPSADASGEESVEARPVRVVLLDPQSTRLGEILSSFDSIRSGLQDLKFVLTVRGTTARDDASWIHAARVAAEQDDAMAVLWTIEESTEHLIMYLYDARRDKLHWRRMRIDPNHRAVTAEALSVVVHAALQSLIEGRALDMEEVDRKRAGAPSDEGNPGSISATQTLPVPQSRPGSWTEAAWGAGYRGTNAAPRADWQHGIELQGTAHPFPWLGGVVALTWLPTTRIAEGGLVVVLGRRLIELGADARLRFGRLQAGVDARVQLEVVTRTTAAVPSGLSKLSKTTDVRWANVFTARLAWPVTEDTKLFTNVGVEIPWSTRTYVLRSTDSTDASPALEEARIRPLGVLGLEYAWSD